MNSCTSTGAQLTSDTRDSAHPSVLGTADSSLEAMASPEQGGKLVELFGSPPPPKRVPCIAIVHGMSEAA